MIAFIRIVMMLFAVNFVSSITLNCRFKEFLLFFNHRKVKTLSNLSIIIFSSAMNRSVSVSMKPQLVIILCVKIRFEEVFISLWSWWLILITYLDYLWFFIGTFTVHDLLVKGFDSIEDFWCFILLRISSNGNVLAVVSTE